MGFPKQVNTQPAIGVPGDFASINPRATALGGINAFVAGPAGVTIGAFCWFDPVLPNVVNSFGAGPVAGFVGRFGLGGDVFTPGPGNPDASFSIPAGQPVTVYSAGDFLVANNGSSPTSIFPVLKAYANNNTGLVSFAATGTPPTSAADTAATLKQIVSASTGGALPVANTATGYITAGVGGAFAVLTVTAVGAGSVLAGGVGQAISGPGIDPNTTIIAQLPGGTVGGAGTYTVSINQNVGSSTATVAIGLSGGGLTLTGANTSGVFAPGMTISGTNIPTGTTILAYGTATAGAAGTYLVDRPATVAATASTVTAANAMLLTVSSSNVGVWNLFDIIAGSSVVANQSIVANASNNANLTGAGGQGTYLTNLQQTALTAQTINVDSAIETKWVAASAVSVGETAKMSTWTLG